MGDILALRDCTAFSAVGTRAHGCAFHSSPYVPVTVAWAPTTGSCCPGKQPVRRPGRPVRTTLTCRAAVTCR
jgi:hypothetical protein